MNCLQAIEKVLRDSEQPLHSSTITRRVLKSGMWASRGKTPEQTVSAHLYSDIKMNGEKSLFIKVAPQTFALRENESDDGCSLNPSPESDENPIESELSFLDAAERVLEQFGNKFPMHYTEITEKAIVNDWLSTSSKIPEATMVSQLATEIKRANANGTIGRFTRVSRGNYGLVKWAGSGLLQQISKHNREVRKELLAEVLALNPYQFEELVGQLLVEMGFDAIEVTKPGGDGGIDVRGTLLIGDVVRIKMAVQAKRWKNTVQRPVIQQVRGSLGVHEQGLIITTGKFSKGSIEEALHPNKSPVALMNGDQLVTLLMEYGIGVRRVSHDLFELGELLKPSDVTPS